MANATRPKPAQAAATPAAPAAQSTTTGTTQQQAAGTEGEQKTKKPRPERVFSAQLNFQAQRKAESKVTSEFNRLARKLKAMGISVEGRAKIVEVLNAEYQVAVKTAVENAGKEEEDEEDEDAATGGETLV